MVRLDGGVRMNTLAWAGAIPATIWLATYAINTLQIVPLGVAAVGLLLVEMIWVWLSIIDDVRVLWGRDSKEI